VNGFAGIELWNYLSELKSCLPNLRIALAVVFLPSLFIQGPFPQTLAIWERLLASGRRVVAIGGADAHANIYALGRARRRVFSYEHMFRAVNTHLLLDTPLPQDVPAARRQVLDALRAGHAFIAYERLGSGRGFTFEATANGATVQMGDEVRLDGALTLRVSAPLPASIRLLKDGQVAAQARGRGLTYQVQVPGVYRVEAYRWHAFKQRAWLFSNPIYVRG
jgi:hypothetical protein